jgi:very-short-patch-repair endonuclease
MQFYSDSLIPLRVPKASEKIDPPLVDVYVHNGIRDENEGTNTAEVEAIVAEIKYIVSDPKFAGRSIGVISLIGSEQAAKIQEALLQELGEDVYQKFDIGCGDSATFQGKEKDIIFLSLVVGPKQGAPLNKREFEQRFNVALSRARDRMYLYRSIRESDLKHGNDLRLRMIRYFSNPMPPRPQVDNPLELCETDFERDVYSRLCDLGYAVTPKVKVGPFNIDLVVEGGRDHRLAVELDGDKPQTIEQWADNLSQQRTLERVGWPFWRCWGSSYTLDPDGCMADLVTTMTSLGIEPIGEQVHHSIYTDYREYRGAILESEEGSG